MSDYPQLEKKLNKIQKLMGGKTIIRIGINKDGKIDLLSAERLFEKDEKQPVVEQTLIDMNDVDYIG